MRKSVLGAIVLTTLLMLVGCSGGFKVKTGTPLETAETFMNVYYFDEGTYEDYKQLYVDQDKVKSEDEFTKYREENKPSDTFGEAKIETVKDALPHFKLKEIDENNAKVYFVEDVNDEAFKTAKFYWILEKQDDKWLMK